MGLETTPVDGIWDLNENWPLGSDSRREADNHMRLIKDAIKKTFPQVLQAINADDSDLNILAGIVAAGLVQSELLNLLGSTENIQAALDRAAYTDLSNIFTALQNIDIPAGGNFLQFDSDADTSQHIVMYQAGGQANGVVISNSNATTKLAQFVKYAADGSQAARVAIINTGEIYLQNILVGGRVLVTSAGDVSLLPAAGRQALYNGNEIATVDQLPVDPALKSDFFTGSVTMRVGQTPVLDTGFGTDNFVWGFSGHNGAGGNNYFVIGVSNTSGEQHYQISDVSGIIRPGAATPGVGQIGFGMDGTASGIDVSFSIWARRMF